MLHEALTRAAHMMHNLCTLSHWSCVNKRVMCELLRTHALPPPVVAMCGCAAMVGAYWETFQQT